MKTSVKDSLGLLFLTFAGFLSLGLMDTHQSAILAGQAQISAIGQWGSSMIAIIAYMIGINVYLLPLLMTYMAFINLRICKRPLENLASRQKKILLFLLWLSVSSIQTLALPAMQEYVVPAGGYIGFKVTMLMLETFEYEGSLLLLSMCFLININYLATHSSLYKKGSEFFCNMKKNSTTTIESPIALIIQGIGQLIKYIINAAWEKIRSMIIRHTVVEEASGVYKEDTSVELFTEKNSIIAKEEISLEKTIEEDLIEPRKKEIPMSNIWNKTEANKQETVSLEPESPHQETRAIEMSMKLPKSSSNQLKQEKPHREMIESKIESIAQLKEKQPIERVFIKESVEEVKPTQELEEKVKEITGAESIIKSSIKNIKQTTTNQLPPLELLHKDLHLESVREDPERIELLRSSLEMRLAEFSVEASVSNVVLGPVISRYEVDLAPGVKAAKVTTLAKDLARSLSVSSVRVVEVIPGKSCIGIEIPNFSRTMVSLHSVLNSESFKISKCQLPLALGVDISGEALITDLCKMPHLLVAGTTGSGKSVGLNAILLSMLFRRKPEDLRLILIDPKMLEFAIYEGIPHLLTPVVTDMKDASLALSWCVMEMERRYKAMAEMGVRNIIGYNEKVKKQRAEGRSFDHEPLPYIVVMADEFADMMMMVGKKVEQSIARLAQKARASGIHLIMATQRPSVDVITGLIKANIPARLAFQVSSKIDSRTIIDQQRADMLLGSGDMLFLEPGSCVPMRGHGAFVADEVALNVVEHLKSLGEPEYIEAITKEEGMQQEFSMYGEAPESTGKSKDDQVYKEAVEYVRNAQKVSISSVQRRLRIGYNRAANLVERMEEEGVISKVDSNGARKVLIA